MKSPIKMVKILYSKVGSIYQLFRCSFFGKTQDLKQLGIYGISFNPPDNSFGVAFSANQDGSDVFVMADRPDLRFTQLQKGELKIGNYLTSSYVYFKTDGTIEINGNVTVNGTVTATDFISSGIGVAYNTHIHTGDDGGDTGVPK